MADRNRTRSILAVATMLTALFSFPAAAVAQGAEDPAFGAARESAEKAAYTISKVQRWLHEVALKKIEPDTGLYHPEGDFNYQDAWADCYPFLVWAAWLTDLDALNGPVRGALHAEIKHCEQGFFTDPRNTFGGSEYVKDGLIAIVEVTGRDEWFDRMQAVQDEIWAKPTIDTKYGKIPSTNIEVNGEQIQALARLYSMTGEKKYLRWAERLADYYLLKGDFVPGRLRDHGCEIIGGLGLLLGVESVHNPDKAKRYLPHVKKMLDTVLEKGTNADGIMHDSLGPKGRLSDGWGYNYVAYLCYDMVVGKSDWFGKLAFDIPRHRIYMGFKHDWPRMNTMPEWFTVEPNQTYVVKNLTRGSQETYTGQQLHEGLAVKLQAGQESSLLITRYANNTNGQ